MAGASRGEAGRRLLPVRCERRLAGFDTWRRSKTLEGVVGATGANVCFRGRAPAMGSNTPRRGLDSFKVVRCGLAAILPPRLVLR